MSRYRVGVVFGSRSTEHEISIITAMQVINFLSDRHEVIPIYITKDGAWFTGKKLASLETFKSFDSSDPAIDSIVITPDRQLQVLLTPLPKGFFGKAKKLDLDVVFPVFHGFHGEDGTIQGVLELADIPYVGAGVMASCIGIDKIITKAVLKENGIPVLDYVWFTRADWEKDHHSIVSEAQISLSFPMIVKPASLGSSIGVQKADTLDSLQFAIDVAIHYDSRIIIERYVDDKIEINCSVLGNEDPLVSVCEQPISQQELLSYEDKYLHDNRNRGMEGASRIIPAPISADLTEKIQGFAIKAFRNIGGLGIARVDFILDGKTDEIYLNELNMMPGSISYYLWEPCGIAPDQLVDKLIELALQAHREKRKTRFSVESSVLQQVDMLGLKKG